MTRKLLPLMLASAAIGAASPAPARETAQHLRSVPLEVRSGDHVTRFQVEVARTVGEQARGLMFRRSLGAHQGMIFPMRPPRPASFWMKNTLIPLDIIFIRPDGRVSSIAAQAKPLSLTPISSTEPVAAVLELSGGSAARFGIMPGALVTSSALR